METQTRSVHDFLPDFFRAIPDVRRCTLLEVTVPPSMEGRPGATPEVAQLVMEARELQGPDDSFTETLLTLAARRGQSDAVLDVAQYHQPLDEASVRHDLPVESLTPETLASLSAAVPSDRMLVLTSEVQTRSGARHIPLADFKLAATEANDQSVLAAAARLGADGTVLVSGSSYHYYGARLMDGDELVKWLLRAQLLSRYIDTRWVTHQLMERRCALRISRGGGAGTVPHVLTTT